MENGIHKLFCPVHPLNSATPLSKGDRIVIDFATGLIWQQSGSKDFKNYFKAQKYIEQLNRKQFGGYKNRRLPTLEEGMSLLESSKKNIKLYNDPVFSSVQAWVWTADGFSKNAPWVVGFNNGICYGSHHTDLSDSYVRAVCS